MSIAGREATAWNGVGRDRMRGHRDFDPTRPEWRPRARPCVGRRVECSCDCLEVGRVAVGATAFRGGGGRQGYARCRGRPIGGLTAWIPYWTRPLSISAAPRAGRQPPPPRRSRAIAYGGAVTGLDTFARKTCHRELVLEPIDEAQSVLWHLGRPGRVPESTGPQENGVEASLSPRREGTSRQSLGLRNVVGGRWPHVRGHMGSPSPEGGG
jgi:hypothetical protein